MDKFERAIRDHEFSNAMVHVRDLLEPLVSKEIKRGHCVAGERECYGGKPGLRKLTMKDVEKIGKTAIFLINRAVNQSHDSDDND